jgi:hypothetical protein
MLEEAQRLLVRAAMRQIGERAVADDSTASGSAFVEATTREVKVEAFPRVISLQNHPRHHVQEPGLCPVVMRSIISEWDRRPSPSYGRPAAAC